MQYFCRWRLDTETQRQNALECEEKQHKELYDHYWNKVEKCLRTIYHEHSHLVSDLNHADIAQRWKLLCERYLLESLKLRNKWQHVDQVLDKWHEKWHSWLTDHEDERLKVKQVLEHVWREELSVLPLPKEGAHWLTMDALYDYVHTCKQQDTQRWDTRWTTVGRDIVFLQQLEQSLKDMHHENLSLIEQQWKAHQAAVERGELKNQATYFYLAFGKKRFRVSMEQHREQTFQMFVDFYGCKSTSLVILPGFGSIPLKLRLQDLALPQEGLELRIVPLQHSTRRFQTDKDA